MEKKKWLIPAGVVALVLLIGLGTWAYQNKNEKKNLLLHEDRGLTDEEKTFFNGRIAQLEENFAKKDISEEDKFETYLSVGANYVLIGEYAKAKQSFEEASKLMPDNVVPYKELLILAGKMGDREAAEKYSNKLIEIDPANKDLYLQMYSEAS
jgi:tetratricopeptide (TPR) repeat protein